MLLSSDDPVGQPVVPTCLCGCGALTPAAGQWLAGHSNQALSFLVQTTYGDVTSWTRLWQKEHPDTTIYAERRRVARPIRTIVQAEPAPKPSYRSIELRLQGEWQSLYVHNKIPVVQIAKRYNVAPATVSKALRRLGVEIRMGSPNRSAPRLPKSAVVERNQRWAQLYTQENWTPEQIAKEYGVSLDTVRRILRALGVWRNQRLLREAQQRQMRQLAQEQALYRQVMDAMANAVPCRVCTCWVLRPTRSGGNVRNRTCSPNCAEIWRAARFRLSEQAHEQHRREMARSILAHQEGKKSSRITWAHRMLSDDPPPANRRYSVSGSQASEAVQDLLQYSTVDPTVRAVIIATSTKVPDPEWERLFQEGLSIRQISATTGASSDRIRRSLHQAGYGELINRRKKDHLRQLGRSRQAEAARLLYERVMATLAVAQPCYYCGSWALRRSKHTGAWLCSPSCGTDWRRISRYVDKDRDLDQQRDEAREVLTGTQQCTASKLSWARWVLSEPAETFMNTARPDLHV